MSGMGGDDDDEEAGTDDDDVAEVGDEGGRGKPISRNRSLSCAWPALTTRAKL